MTKSEKDRMMIACAQLIADHGGFDRAKQGLETWERNLKYHLNRNKTQARKSNNWDGLPQEIQDKYGRA